MNELLAKLDAAGIRLRNRGGELAVAGNKAKIDAALVGELRLHKAALLEMIGAESELWWSPPAIRPEMLPLVSLTQAEIDRVVAEVPGGARNVQDIYPLAPLQEGILFHHLLATDGDPYLLSQVVSFDARERVDAFLGALQCVVDRHDILRTAIVWEGLPEPVQVVWRQAPLQVEEVRLHEAGGSAERQLRARVDPRQYRMELGRAPLIRAFVARDEDAERWVVLLLTHHLINDHTTLDVLQHEVQAFLAGRQDRLPAPVPFRNLVAQARLGVSRAEHEEFFTRMLGDVCEPTAPFGLLDVQGDGSGIDEAHLVVDAGVAARLRERARKLGVSTASLCHVAFAQVLARVSGREDVVFGTVLFGRMNGGAAADRVVGLFINTLPIRIQVGEAGVEESVRGTHAVLADLMRHEHASLALAQRCSGVRAPAPLFSALLNYRHSAGGGKARPAGPAPEMASEERSNYPLLVAVDDLGDGFALKAQVLASVGAMRVCALMSRAMEALAGALESAPSRPIRSVDVLPAAERSQVLRAFNATAAEYPRHACMHELFEAHAERTPGATALVCGARELTYDELNARANRLAHHLRALGVGPDSRVAICLDRGAEMVVALLATLKAGGAYVPLDPAYPADRLRYMLEDSRPRAVLTQAAHAALFVDVDAPVLDVRAPIWDSCPETNPEREGLSPENLAYIIYTSGSTGLPKGVMLEHRGVVNLLCSMGETVGIAPADRVLALTTIAFDISVLEIFLPLVSGASVVMVDRATAADPDLLAAAVAAHAPTVMQATPATWRMLLECGWRGNPTIRALSGGEALPVGLARELVARVGSLWNVFGPTETTIWSSAQRVDAGTLHERATVPIGAPLWNTCIYVLDAAGEPVPAGVAGELFIGGDGVARGYLNRPELTAERFVADPFSGGRMYRTGDLGRWLPDGTIEYLGRNDFQVKIRGFRIELGEIESRIAGHPRVREAAVVASEERLVAYFVADGELGAGALRAHLAEGLPEYMVPSAFIRMDAFPLTLNGKLDRKALPAPEGGTFAAREYEAPLGEVEVAVAGIWATVLGVERVGRWDHFFEMGGHSLRAVQVTSRVRQALGVDVALGGLFAKPVLADYARGLAAAAKSELAAIERAERGGPLALSFAQQRLWFLEQLGSGGRAYHIPTSLRFHGALDALALRRALDRVVERHEVLRTTFAQVAGEPVQVIAPEGAFALAEHDLAGHPDADAELRRLMAEEAGAPFHLEHGP
ncbi:MAG TPA: amino acid adenylation domain-containing protein, partial [Longimicrobium sp.]